jgi:hypothetical protein
MVDSGEYPAFLLGGDVIGWINWHSKWDGVNDIPMPGNRIASNKLVRDPLIEGGYFTYYPENPFVVDGRTIVSKTNIDGGGEPGDGDPRFGWIGTNMGEGLDDMNYFRGATHPGPYFWSTIETRRTLDHGDWMNVPQAFIDPNTNMYYLFGGRRSKDPKSPNDVVYIFWPGNFFYKAAYDQIMIRESWTIPVPNTNVPGHFNHYILGGYGAEGTKGVDIIRLEDKAPDGSEVGWRSPPPFPFHSFLVGYVPFIKAFGEAGGLPEVFGGGDAWNGPWEPYNASVTTIDDKPAVDPDHPLYDATPGKFIYGAPDGVPDGVIIVLTDRKEETKQF